MEGATGQSQEGGHRAVVWHAPDTAPPPNLMAALAARGIEATGVQSSYVALAQLCRAGRGASPALVIVHPETMSDAVALWQAKSRYAPGARCWMYGPAASPTLRAIVEGDIMAWGGGDRREPEVVVKPQPNKAEDSLKIGPRRDPPGPKPRSGGPRLKLAGEPLPLPPPGGEPAEEASPAPLLTPEELRMLLGDDEPGATEQRS